MSRRRSNVARLGPPDPVLVRYAGSNAAAPLVSYIVCINVWVPERYEVWSLNAQGVREVHLTDRVKLFDLFYEDTFRSTLYDSRRCRIPFIGREALNGSVEFICYQTSLRTVLQRLYLPEISLCIPGGNIRHSSHTYSSLNFFHIFLRFMILL